MKLAVLGVGLIGGSIGLAAQARAGARVIGWDTDPSAGSRARAQGAIDEDAARIADAVAGADVVFVAVPVGSLVPTVQAALHAAGPDAVVTDVGSTKRAVVEAISDPRFVGGHPLAGSELAGVEHAREDLFEGAAWFLCGEDASSAAQERLNGLVKDFGARPVRLDATTHDRLMANVSQLPHVLANLLVAQAAAVGESDGLQIVAGSGSGSGTGSGSGSGSGTGTGTGTGHDGRARSVVGPSFRDATRVAGSNSAIWTDIYMSNRQALAAAIEELIPKLERVREMLTEGDAQALTEWNEHARAQRQALLGETAEE